jgi:hypothetical protein
VTRARRSARSRATTAARTRRSPVGTGFAPAKPVRRLRLSDRRHARRPAPATTQAPEQHVGHRPPRTHRQCPPAGVPRPTPVRTRVSQPVLDASAKDVPYLSQFAATATAFTGPPAATPKASRLPRRVVADPVAVVPRQCERSFANTGPGHRGAAGRITVVVRRIAPALPERAACWGALSR